ncbi:FEKKY domain-containing protein [Sinomicrobium sp. M5D2P17]
MKKLILTILFLNSIIGVSQNEKANEVLIKGIVLSEVNEKPLENVYVSYKSRYQFSATDKNGNFNYKYAIRDIDSLETIELTALGYENLDTIIRVDKPKEYVFEFVMKPRFGLSREKALKDIKNGEVNILESSGIAPVFYKSDTRFAKKYKVNFIEYGCEGVAWESLYEYNRTVFEYLDKKYGKKWRKKIRKDIVGLKEENE